MTTRKFVYDQNLGKMVEVTGKAQPETRKGPYIMGDIKPYRTIGPEHGREISSRSQHREYLRRYNLDEVGPNDKKYFGLSDD